MAIESISLDIMWLLKRQRKSSGRDSISCMAAWDDMWLWGRRKPDVIYFALLNV